MGGYGSGQYQSYHAKTLVEHAEARLSIFEFHKHGFSYNQVGTGSLKWPNGWTVLFKLSQHVLYLMFTIDGAPCVTKIHVVETYPHFGGSRTWFLCPICRRRCAMLYIADNRPFACRLCHKLVHASTRILSGKKELDTMARALASFDARMDRRQELVQRLIAQDVGR